MLLHEMFMLKVPTILALHILCVQYQRFEAYLTWERRLRMLHDVAAGMCELHGRNVAHGDLRSPNLFVGADGKVRLQHGAPPTA